MKHTSPGRSRTCGIDEVGRGALAGPFVAAAVVLTGKTLEKFSGTGLKLRDSKLLSGKQREAVMAWVTRIRIPVSVTIIPVSRIAADGIGVVNRQVFTTLIRTLPAERYIIDGKLRPAAGDTGQQGEIVSRIDADETEPAVMLAAIVAKVTRDRLMRLYHQRYPWYGWDANVGYGTRAHITAIISRGLTPLHRISFVRTALAHRGVPFPYSAGTSLR